MVAGNLEFATLKAGSSSLACGVTTSGNGYCWDLNWRGEIGGMTVEQCEVGSFLLDCAATPVRVPGINDEPFQDISPGLSYACGLSTEGNAACWGTNGSGQLGNVASEIRIGGPGLFDVSCNRTALPVFGEHHFLSITTGRQHTCGVTATHRGLCWGLNDLGQLGNGVPGSEPRPGNRAGWPRVRFDYRRGPAQLRHNLQRRHVLLGHERVGANR